MLNMILISAALLSAFVWAVTIYSKKKKLYVASRRELKELETVLEPATKQEENLKAIKEKYAALQSNYKKRLATLKRNEDRLSQFNIGVGTSDSVVYTKITNTQSVNEIEYKLDSVKHRLKEEVRSKNACICKLYGQMEINGRKAAANKFFNREIKLRLRCIDNEFKAASALADWNNINRLIARTRKAYSDINERGDIVQTTIQSNYLNLKIEELKLGYELKLAKQDVKEAEREEARLIREAEREEKRIQAAAEKAEKERILMEELVAKELSKLESFTQEQKELFELHKQQLEQLKEKEQRAMSLAQLTRAGYVYVISNVKSFGEGVVKIGMTRRADPNDRVKELGDASVPELFDVHAFAFTEDAPALEKHLHNEFADKRMNLVNGRKEFFFADPEAVLSRFDSYNGHYEFSELVS